MSNAWFYYFFPLLIGTAFLAAGLTVFRRFARGYRDTKGRQYGSADGCLGILFTIVGATLALGIVLSSPTPWTRQRLFDHVFHTPAELIKRVVIQPGQPNQYRPLTNSQILIDDAVRIRRIAEVLHATQEVSPNHPRARWTARIRMVTDDGTYCFGVEATVPGDPNGTLINVSSNPDGGGWNLGSVRANGLERILEEAANTGLPAAPAVPPRGRSEQ